MITPAPAPQVSVLRIWFSNLKERILFFLFGLINRHIRYVLIEGDTTTQDANGDFPVSNAGITISHRVAAEIFADTVPYEAPQYTDKYCTLTFILQREGRRNYGFSVCPVLDDYQQQPILSPILFDTRWHTYGFQPCTPTVMRMLNDWGLPVSSSVVLPVERRFDKVNSCYEYYIANPSEASFPFGLIRRIVLRNTFRFPDKRSEKK